MDAVLQIVLLGGLFFLMMKFGCGSHSSGHGEHGNSSHGNSSKAKKAGGGCCGGKKQSADVAKKEQAEDVLPENDADPVCHQTVPTDRAKTSLYNGLVYFFCSHECREEFERNPEKYAVSGAEPEI